MSLKYRPEIDGLRTFAIIPVVLFHMYPEILPAGYLGVDVFFVISGYLITGIILRDLANGKFSFKDFWLRRARRILPALLAMTIFTLVFGAAILFPPEVRSLGKQGLAAIFSVANIYFWKQSGGYWSYDAENMPLLHTWSLSLEEQFYLFFPLLLAMIAKFSKKPLRTSLYFVSLIFLTSLALFIWGLQYYPKATFYLLPTRIWELGAGCLLAVISAQRQLDTNSILAKLYSGAGLLMVVSSFVFLPASLSIFTIITILGTTLVIAYADNKDSLSYKILSYPPMVYVGRLSYSLYLWHWPLLVFARNYYFKGELPLTPWMMILPISICSLLSYYFIEKTTRSSSRVHKPLLLAVGGSILLSLLLVNKTTPLDLSAYAQTEWNGELYNISPYRDPDGEARMQGIAIARPQSYDTQQQLYKSGGLIKSHTKFEINDKPQVIVMGDSHALMWAKLLDNIFEEQKLTAAFNSANASPLFFEIPVKETEQRGMFSKKQQMVYDTTRLQKIRQWRPKLAILVMRWSLIEDVSVARDLMELFKEIGTKVIFIEQPPELFFGARNAPAYLSFMEIFPDGKKKQFIKAKDSLAFRRGRKILGEIASNYGATIIPTLDLYQNDEEVMVLDGDKVLYVDYDHLSEAGAVIAEKRIRKAIIEALK